MMKINFTKEICNDYKIATNKEWLVTNGIGGYSCGTVSGILTRRYHGLLIASLNPPLNRHLLLTKLIETVEYNDKLYDLDSNLWKDNTIAPEGYLYCQKFYLEGTNPIWEYSCGNAILKKQIWMEQGKNTTYIKYSLDKGNLPLKLNLKALVNYRNHHHLTSNSNEKYTINKIDNGLKIIHQDLPIPFYIFAKDSQWQIFNNIWYFNFKLELEKYREQDYIEHHLLAGSCDIKLNLNESITVVATTQLNPELDGEISWQKHKNYEKQLLDLSQLNNSPNWSKNLILASHKFIVNRNSLDNINPISLKNVISNQKQSFQNSQSSLTDKDDIQKGKTIIAGYPWFSDWGRDTMISLSGLTLVTGKFSTARKILLTFAKYLDEGMLPNCFPEKGYEPYYNTVDATLWYFEAIENYLQFTQDFSLINELFEPLQSIIEYYIKGTRYNIHLDDDGLIFAGQNGSQLTWMDAKVGKWVVTPRIGKPIEINALWYNALVLMAKWSIKSHKKSQYYQKLAHKTRLSFQKFWHQELNYCYDVLDTPEGNDSSLRPNQIFAVSLPTFTPNIPSLLTTQQRKSLITNVSKELLTPYGLRSLNQIDSNYQGIYGGNIFKRDSAYHQGTVWGWLIGHFIQAHLKVYQDKKLALSFLTPFKNHLQEAGINQISEIFDGNSPNSPRGCFAQAWSVAELLRAFYLIENC